MLLRDQSSEYYEMRAKLERALAGRAASIVERARHLEIARRYAQLASAQRRCP